MVGDKRATEDGRPYLTAVRRAGGIVVGATVLGRPFPCNQPPVSL